MISSSAPRFEGSYLGNSAQLPSNARLECKICWWVYDPAVGDPVWQIEPGTAFNDLPAIHSLGLYREEA